MGLIKKDFGYQTKNLIVNKKVVICDMCRKEIEVRWGVFANQTLLRHKKMEHK